jgi:hypothetical protein
MFNKQAIRTILIFVVCVNNAFSQISSCDFYNLMMNEIVKRNELSEYRSINRYCIYIDKKVSVLQKSDILRRIPIDFFNLQESIDSYETESIELSNCVFTDTVCIVYLEDYFTEFHNLLIAFSNSDDDVVLLPKSVKFFTIIKLSPKFYVSVLLYKSYPGYSNILFTFLFEVVNEYELFIKSTFIDVF